MAQYVSGMNGHSGISLIRDYHEPGSVCFVGHYEAYFMHIPGQGRDRLAECASLASLHAEGLRDMMSMTLGQVILFGGRQGTVDHCSVTLVEDGHRVEGTIQVFWFTYPHRGIEPIIVLSDDFIEACTEILKEVP